jgi:hypothetical protein
MSDEPEQLMGEDLGPCVFCGKTIAYGISPEDGKPDSLIHEMPMCEKFQSMGPEEFIVAMREELERRQPS